MDSKDVFIDSKANAAVIISVHDLADRFIPTLLVLQEKTKSSKNISSIADMQNFVEAYPQFKKLSGDVSKHVTLLGEINRIVDKESLMEVSQVRTQAGSS